MKEIDLKTKKSKIDKFLHKEYLQNKIDLVSSATLFSTPSFGKHFRLPITV